MARISGKDGPGCSSIVLWPNQSLGRQGARLLAGLVAAGMGLVAAGPLLEGAWPVVTMVLGTLAFFILALRHHRRVLRYRQIVEVTPARVHISHEGPCGPPVRSLDTAWARVEVETDLRVENRVLLRQSRRAVEVGAFLSPEERADVAREISAAILKARSAR